MVSVTNIVCCALQVWWLKSPDGRPVYVTLDRLASISRDVLVLAALPEWAKVPCNVAFRARVVAGGAVLEVSETVIADTADGARWTLKMPCADIASVQVSAVAMGCPVIGSTSTADISCVCTAREVQ